MGERSRPQPAATTITATTAAQGLENTVSAQNPAAPRSPSSSRKRRTAWRAGPAVSGMIAQSRGNPDMTKALGHR
ncbi:hypothetical protein ACFFX0_23975 [Citricoccus parietis]|uniref:Uncharacterized protein n=1 Tax=Citricoccus parietis TaxID=592307 RepID=A0ABV5G558_9MICC